MYLPKIPCNYYCKKRIEIGYTYRWDLYSNPNRSVQNLKFQRERVVFMGVRLDLNRGFFIDKN